MSDFDVTNWYWLVNGNASQVYSSARGDFFSISDPAYVAWQAGGNAPSVIDTSANLGAYLADRAIRPLNATVLDAYTGAQADEVLAKVAFKILFNHENRLRTIERQLALNGSPPALTAGQARAAVKALM